MLFLMRIMYNFSIYSLLLHVRIEIFPPTPPPPPTSEGSNRHLLPDEHLGDAAGIPDDQEVLVDVRDVQIAAVLGRLGEVHLAPQHCGALVRLGEAEGGA